MKNRLPSEFLIPNGEKRFKKKIIKTVVDVTITCLSCFDMGFAIEPFSNPATCNFFLFTSPSFEFKTR
jgi:hypothetical protein